MWCDTHDLHQHLILFDSVNHTILYVQARRAIILPLTAALAKDADELTDAALFGERDAAKTVSGRERLDAVFLQFKQHADAQQPFSPDVASLRRALGLG